jgi:hypothetical protein
LYAFDTTPFDAEPPRALEPSLSVRSRDGQILPQLISNDRPIIVPGRAPIYIAVELEDIGSGIDASSFKVTLNGNDLPADKILFQPASGILTAVLADSVGTQVTTLPDGVYNIGLVARDFRGNILTYTGSFTVDKTVPAPTERSVRTRPRNNVIPGEAPVEGAPLAEDDTQEVPAPAD